VNTWKVILATLVIFGAGVVTGGLLVGYSDRALHSSQPPQPLPTVQHEPTNAPVISTAHDNRPVPPPNALFRKDFMDRLNHELDLSPEQHDQIEKIVSEGQDRTRELWRVEWIETRQKIRKELAPRQQSRFEELFKSRPHEKLRPNPAHQNQLTNAPAMMVSSNEPAVNP
jgi:hypothetical protein